MFIWLMLILSVTTSFAQVGKISKIVGAGDAYILRGQARIAMIQDANLELGDELFSNESVLVLHLYPSSQISLAKNSQIRINQSLIEGNGEKEKSFSVISFIRGLVRIQVTRDSSLEIDQKIIADGVAFAVRGTEFEVSKEGDDFDLDVMEGEVEVSSPFVQTFVPEIVKANEGFRFNKKEKNFKRRKFKTKFKNHPGFAGQQEIREKWKKKRSEFKQGRAKKTNHNTMKGPSRIQRRTGRLQKQNKNKYKYNK
jgi:hypothetical protein